MDHESDGDTNCGWYTWNNLQRTGRLENKRTSRDHPDYIIIKIGQNTEKSPGDLRKLAVTQNYNEKPSANSQRNNNNNNNNNNNKARHDWVGKVIHWEMCRKFQFDHTNKWHMHNPAPVLENDSDKLLWDFNIQTDHLILARRPDLIIINKKRESAKLLTLLSRRTTE